MELIAYYLLFAFTTSITACIFWFWPLVQEARQLEVVNSFTQYPKVSAVIYIFVSAVVAPMLVPPMFSQNMADKFSRGLRSEILKSDAENQS
jgi:hypothetical protein